jgi:hypothetical protein
MPRRSSLQHYDVRYMFHKIRQLSQTLQAEASSACAYKVLILLPTFLHK